MEIQILKHFTKTGGKKYHLVYLPETRQLYLRQSISGKGIFWWEVDFGSVQALPSNPKHQAFICEAQVEGTTNWLDKIFNVAKKGY